MQRRALSTSKKGIQWQKCKILYYSVSGTMLNGTYPESPFSAAFHFLVLPHQTVLLFLPIPGLIANGLHVLLIFTADALHLFRHWHDHLQACCSFVRAEICSHLDEDDRLQHLKRLLSCREDTTCVTLQPTPYMHWRAATHGRNMSA